MKKLLLTGIAVLLLFLKPAFANHGVEALGVLVYLFAGIAAALLLGVVFSIVAYRTNKVVWKILAAIPTIALMIAGFFVVSIGDVIWIGYAMVLMGVVNVLLITNARKPKQQDVAAP